MPVRGRAPPCDGARVGMGESRGGLGHGGDEPACAAVQRRERLQLGGVAEHIAHVDNIDSGEHEIVTDGEGDPRMAVGGVDAEGVGGVLPTPISAIGRPPDPGRGLLEGIEPAGVGSELLDVGLDIGRR